VGHDALNGVISSGGKLVLTNQSFPGTFPLPETSANTAHLEPGSAHLYLARGVHP